MKPQTVFLLGAALAVSPIVQAASEAAPASVDVSGAIKSGGLASLRRDLSAAILAREAGAVAESLLKDADYRRLLFAHEVLRVTGEKSAADFLASDKDSRAFLAAFLADAAWMEAYLASGRVPADTTVGLAVLRDIWKSESRHPKFAAYHELSCALASVWGAGTLGDHYRRGSERQGLHNLSPLWRYRFFRDKHLAGKLHRMFGDLKAWEIHYVVGTRYEDASIAWLNENINVPLRRYTDACWVPTYRGANDFGEHVQGPLFYRAWDDYMSTAETTKVHGGVCGSLSHFGAYSAAAHGIPSYTCGQPGHCAYAVRFARGDWRGGFGGPDGWPHVAIWQGNIHFVQLMEKVFGDDEGLRKALAHAARARVFAGAGEHAKAESAYDAALAASPYHRELHLEKIAFLQSRADAAYWRAYAESLLPTLGSFGAAGREVIAAVSSKFLSGAGAGDDAALAWFVRENTAYAAAPESWAWGFDKEVLEKQSARFSNSPAGDAARERLFRETLAAQFASEKRPQLGKVIDWGVGALLEKGKADAFGRAFAEAASTASAGSKGDEKSLREAYSKAIVGVEKARSVGGFQALGKAAQKFADKPRELKLDKPAGKLVSDKGALRLSSYAWDHPVNHYGVLNEAGGAFHTDREAAPHAIVTLPAGAEITGLLVIKTDSHEYRMKRMKAYRSTDGETWFPLAEVADMPKQWRIDCPAGTQARWIKIESQPSEPEFMHLRNILVYAKE